MHGAAVRRSGGAPSRACVVHMIRQTHRLDAQAHGYCGAVDTNCLMHIEAKTTSYLMPRGAVYATHVTCGVIVTAWSLIPS
jgi:hypothetical protein